MKKGLLVLGIATSSLIAGGCITSAYASKQAYVNTCASARAYVNGEEEQETIEKLKEEWEKFKNTYLAPLAALGIGVPTALSIAGFVVNSYFKKKLKQEVADVETQKAQATELLTKVTATLEEVKNFTKLSSEEKAEIQTMINSINNSLKSNEKIANSLDKLSAINKLLIDLQVKVSSVNDDAVRAGIMDEISEIQSLASSI